MWRKMKNDPDNLHANTHEQVPVHMHTHIQTHMHFCNRLLPADPHIKPPIPIKAESRECSEPAFGGGQSTAGCRVTVNFMQLREHVFVTVAGCGTLMRNLSRV